MRGRVGKPAITSAAAPADRSSQPYERQLEEVLAASNARRQKTVLGLIDVLEHLRARGATKFSVAVVGRECEERKLLTTQYLRNANGSPLRRLIEAYRDRHGLTADDRPVSRQTPMEEAIGKIGDLDVRTRLFAMVDDNKALVAQLRRLEEGFKHLSVPAAAAGSTALAAPELAAELLPPEAAPTINLRPVERFLSAEWLDQNAWNVTEMGTIMDGENALTPPGFVTSLKQVLAAVRKGYDKGRVIEDG